MSKRHEVHVFDNGTASIRNTELGETMHSRVGPDEEAHRVYIEQSRLTDRLRFTTPEPLVLYDVGMGIASNALAAIEARSRLPSSRGLHIVSFENTLEGLTLALAAPASFPLQARYREALRSLIENSKWTDGSVLWELRLGDFRQASLLPAPEVIFYDFYSPKSSPELWRLREFTRIFDACKETKRPAVLTTYSAATLVRSALFLAGFHVGYGARTEIKTETTIASSTPQEIRSPLGREWLERLSRSSKPFPEDVLSPQEALKNISERIRSGGPLRG